MLPYSLVQTLFLNVKCLLINVTSLIKLLFMSITPFVLSIKCKCDLMSQFGENYKEKKGRKKHRMLHIIKTRFCLTVINVRKQDIFFLSLLSFTIWYVLNLAFLNGISMKGDVDFWGNAFYVKNKIWYNAH